MRKLFTAAFAATMLVGLLVMPATADESPANNASKCGEVGGTYSEDTSVSPKITSCVVSGQGSSLVPASHKTQAWKAEVSTPGATYFKQGGNYWSTGGGSSVQTGCFNHNGNAITDWQTNKNCVPA